MLGKYFHAILSDTSIIFFHKHVPNIKWASVQQKVQLACAPIYDSDQPAHSMGVLWAAKGKVGRSKPHPVLTSGFNQLKPSRSICKKVVNTGQYESEWSIENSKGRFCGGLRYLYRFCVLSIEKEKTILIRPCQGLFSWWDFHLKTLPLSSALQSMLLTLVLASSKAE